MEHNFQTSTLSLTLPISCQICLGKVRQPVVCSNYHVFCSGCMETWLQKASQCPTCRAPITADSPCREILGGTNESEHSDSHYKKKCLRKTRGELLLREYEDEIDGLLKENKELKMKNQSLETQLKSALDPCSVTAVHAEDKSVDPYVLEELTGKLRAATEVCSKVNEDMEKLREANKTLRSQNFDLVQENMRLKAEVASRSPQKFGRYTVAALEAKIQQYERDVDHLKRALQRSDQYIEDLESRVGQCERRPPVLQEGATEDNKTGSEDPMEQQKIKMMRRSLSDTERESICSNPEAESQTLPGSQILLFTSSAGASDQRDFAGPAGQHNLREFDSPSSSFFPTTPSSAFRSLTLKSPGLREKKVAFQPGSYLRRLSFEELPSSENGENTASHTENQFTVVSKFPQALPATTKMEASKSTFWGDWQGADSNDQSGFGPSTEELPMAKAVTSDGVLGRFQISSEASMDAAYLDKISELDSMMLEGESSSSRGSQFSLASASPRDQDTTLVPEPKTGSASDEREGHMILNRQQSQPLCNGDGTLTDPQGHAAEEGSSRLESGGQGGARALDSAVIEGTCQTDELSFDMLFDPLVDSKAGTSDSHCPESHLHDHRENPSAGCGDGPGNTRDRHTSSVSQPIKRKSHSPFTTNSPTKLSKLM